MTTNRKSSNKTTSKQLVESLIEEAVQTVINEQDGGDYGDSYGDYGGAGGGGGSSGSSSQLYNTFVRPFTDVAQTAMGGLKVLSAQAQTVVKGIILGLPTLVIPFLEYDYKEFRKEEKEKVDKIKEEYKEVLGRNWAALESNDAFGLAFLLNPTAALGANLALTAPEVALSILGSLTGGSIEAVNQLASSFHVNTGFHGPGSHGTNVDMMKEAANPKLSQAIQKLLKDPKVIAAINNNPIVKKTQQEVVGSMTDRVKRTMAVQDYAHLSQLLPGLAQKLNAQLVQQEQARRMSPQEDAAAKAQLVPQIKAQYRNFYIKKFGDEEKANPSASALYQNAIKQISALK